MNNYIYNININVAFAKEYSLSFEHCALLKFFMMLPNRSDYTNNEWVMYYRANMKKIHEQLPLLSDKDDTVYRYIKALIDKWLLQKLNKIDYYRVTDLWLKYELIGNKSEQPEINPIPTGNKSDTVPEINPTYNNTIYNKNNNSEKEKYFNDFWWLYPNKKSKDKAKEIFTKKIDSWIDPLLLIAWAKKYKLSTIGTDISYIKHPTTRLNQWCRDDDVTVNIQYIINKYKQEVAKDKDNKATIYKDFTEQYWIEVMKQVLEKINWPSFISNF